MSLKERQQCVDVKQLACLHKPQAFRRSTSGRTEFYDREDIRESAVFDFYSRCP